MADTTSPAEREEPTSVLAHVERVSAIKMAVSPPYRMLIPDVKITKASPEGRIVALMELRDIHVNSKGGLHGTASAAIVDWSAGMAIVAKSGGEKTGVSTDIHISYVSSARVGDVLEIECWVNKLGRTLAYTQVEIRKVGTDGGKGPVVVTGSHTKFVA